MKFILLIFALWSTQVSAASMGQVELSQFKPGTIFSWRHSELNTRTGAWEPYLIERYIVANVSGTQITMEMSSDPPSATTISAPHHKFIFDFKDCDIAKTDSSERRWTVEFYTTSITGSWSLVSTAHPNYVFTEKFNCLTPTETEAVQTASYALPDATYSTARIERGIREDTSWYLIDHPQLQGVMAIKVFEPTKNYRAELITQ